MKDVDKRARIKVALAGLALLLQNCLKDKNYASTRNNLIAMPKGDEQDQAILNAIRSRTWQKPYVKRLVAAGILKHQDADTYQPVDLKELGALIIDHEEPNYGLRLSQFIFPSEAGLPKELRGDTSSEVEEEVVDSEEATEEVNDEMIVIKSFDMQLMIASLQRLVEGTRDLQDEMRRLNKAKDESQQNTEVIPYMRNRTRELNKRLDDLEVLIQGLHGGNIAIASAVARIDATVAGAVSSMRVIHDKVAQLDAGAVASAVTSAVRESLGFTGAPDGTTLVMFMRETFKRFEGNTSKRAAAEKVLSTANDLAAAAELLLQNEESEQ